MKRSPEKVSGRCARISIYLSPRLPLLSRFEIVSRRCSKPGLRASKVERRRANYAYRSSEKRWFVPVSLSERAGAGNRDICSREIVLSPGLPGGDRWTGHKFKLQLLRSFKDCFVHLPLVFAASLR